MNSKQTAFATVIGAAAAESLIGGIGIGMLGTAVGVPAAAVVATVGGTVAAVKAVNENKPRIKAWAADLPKVYFLKKGDTTVRFRVHPVSQKGSYAFRYNDNDGFCREYHYSAEVLRQVYKNFLNEGFKAIA